MALGSTQPLTEMSTSSIYWWVKAQDIIALEETMLLEKDFMNMKSHTLFYTQKEKGTREFVVAFLVDTCTKGMYLTLKAVDDSTRIVRIKTKFLKF
jgi:hypothetical protein